jgi:methionyl-tRNA formyltransferase
MNEVPHIGRGIPLRIALIGREAPIYVDKFPHANCRVVEDAHEISDTDDLVFCVCHPMIIPANILTRPRHGVWVNHSSDLPKGRGWAPLQWSVLKALPEITVTIFKAVAECDAGPWAFKVPFPIEPHDTIETLRLKDRVVSINAFHRLIQAILEDRLLLHEQTGTPSYWDRRRLADSELDASQSLAKLWDHIRVCDNTDYPAFFMVEGRKVILRYEVKD